MWIFCIQSLFVYESLFCRLQKRGCNAIVWVQIVLEVEVQVDAIPCKRFSSSNFLFTFVLYWYAFVIIYFIIGMVSSNLVILFYWCRYCYIKSDSAHNATVELSTYYRGRCASTRYMFNFQQLSQSQFQNVHTFENLPIKRKNGHIFCCFSKILNIRLML